ncbi:hypothetical protein AB5I41_02115 [Sphingomonas sp. MMS24-JH45]
MDTDGDGRLTFDEWVVKTSQRFAAADRDGSGALTPAEFATTRPKSARPAPAAPVHRPRRGDEAPGRSFTKN